MQRAGGTSSLRSVDETSAAAPAVVSALQMAMSASGSISPKNAVKRHDAQQKALYSKWCGWKRSDASRTSAAYESASKV